MNIYCLGLSTKSIYRLLFFQYFAMKLQKQPTNRTVVFNLFYCQLFDLNFASLWPRDLVDQNSRCWITAENFHRFEWKSKAA